MEECTFLALLFLLAHRQPLHTHYATFFQLTDSNSAKSSVWFRSVHIYQSISQNFPDTIYRTILQKEDTLMVFRRDEYQEQ